LKKLVSGDHLVTKSGLALANRFLSEGASIKADQTHRLLGCLTQCCYGIDLARCRFAEFH
jgi:hypothetical protein